MHAVCMVKNVRGDNTPWARQIFDAALKNGLVTGTWETFNPRETISLSELYTLSARASDWAEKTGGCNPKPAECLK